MTIKQNDYALHYKLSYLESLVETIANHVLEKDRECPICKTKLNVFMPYGANIRKNADCPICHSKERHRFLWLYFEKNNIFDRCGKILHFAPEKFFYDKFSSLPNIDYWPADIRKLPTVRTVVDITDIPFSDSNFDVIICNHVLEHVTNDQKAISELYRVLSPNGVAFINVPIDMKRATTLENSEYNTPELRFKYYGQHDHVRLYGRDFPRMLEKAGFLVDEVHCAANMSSSMIYKYGLSQDGVMYVCKK